MKHTIVAVRFARAEGCESCGPDTPHNVVARCACGETATGKSHHIWTVTSRTGDLVTLAPSFAWQPPREPEHLHEFVIQIPLAQGNDW